MWAVFAGRLWLGLEVFPDGRAINHYEQGFELSRALSLPMVACGDVHMHHPDRKPLLDVVSAVSMRQSIRVAGRLLFANREKYLRPLPVIQALYPRGLIDASN